MSSYKHFFIICSFVLTSLLTIQTSFSANGDGICDASEAAKNQCLVLDGYVVEALTGIDDEFPISDGVNSTFSYLITGPGNTGGGNNTKAISHVDIGFPICIDNPLQIISADPSEYTIEPYDPSTGFDAGEGFDVLKWNQSLKPNQSRIFSLVLSGFVGVDLVQLLIKNGDGHFSGSIVGPSCKTPSIAVSKSCNSQSILADGETLSSSFTVQFENDGDTLLSNVQLKEDNTDFNCEIVTVDGIDVTPIEVGGSYVSIPSAGNFDGNLIPSEIVTVGLSCEHDQPDLVNDLSGQASAGNSLNVNDSATADMASECPYIPNPSVSILKNCPSSGGANLVQNEQGIVVVKLCPTISVTNDGSEKLQNVTITDVKIPNLASGYDIGDLSPGQTVALEELLDLCYYPDNQNDFSNTASVSALGLFGIHPEPDSDSTECKLCPEPEE